MSKNVQGNASKQRLKAKGNSLYNKFLVGDRGFQLSKQVVCNFPISYYHYVTHFLVISAYSCVHIFQSDQNVQEDSIVVPPTVS